MDNRRQRQKLKSVRDNNRIIVIGKCTHVYAERLECRFVRLKNRKRLCCIFMIVGKSFIKCTTTFNIYIRYYYYNMGNKDNKRS